MKKIISMLIVGCFMVSATLADVAYWTFDEQTPGTATTAGDVMLDVDGGDSNLVVFDAGTTTPSYVTPDTRYNPLGAALGFDRDFDMRLVIEPNAVDVDIDTDCTIEAVVYLDTPVADITSAEHGFMQKNGTLGSWWFRFDDDNGRTNLSAYNYITPDSSFKVASGNACGANQWVHIAAVRDSLAGEWRIYHDYDLVLTNPDGAAGESLANDGSVVPFQIGTIDSTNPAKRFNGAIDFIRISDTALDPNDFVQPIGTPSDPNPADDATLVPLDQIFSWTPISGETIISQTVTLSDTPDMSNVLETISPAGNSVTFTSLEKGMQYYWVVDSLLDYGAAGTWLQPGLVWSFNTPACMFGLAEGDLDDNCTINIVDFSIMAGNWLRTDEYE